MRGATAKCPSFQRFRYAVARSHANQGMPAKHSPRALVRRPHRASGWPDPKRRHRSRRDRNARSALRFGSVGSDSSPDVKDSESCARRRSPALGPSLATADREAAAELLGSWASGSSSYRPDAIRRRGTRAPTPTCVEAKQVRSKHDEHTQSRNATPSRRPRCLAIPRLQPPRAFHHHSALP